MESASSQLLNQFKLFSQKDKPISTSTSNTAVSSFLSLKNAKYYVLFCVLILAIGLYIHFGLDNLQNWVADFGSKLLLQLHLSPTGELSSIYVPNNFFLSSE